MTIDMTNNRVPYGLLTDEEKAALYNHKGEFMSWSAGHWVNSGEVSTFYSNVTYRPLPVEKTQDVIAWEKLPDWAEWVARDSAGWVYAWAYKPNAFLNGWDDGENLCRIDDWPGIVQIGTCDWKESKQRRPK
jgi:hypothetical protein